MGGDRLWSISQCCSWQKHLSDYGPGRGFSGKCVGGNEKGIIGANQNYGAKIKRDFGGMVISHGGDLLISGADALIAYMDAYQVNTACEFFREARRSISAWKSKRRRTNSMNMEILQTEPELLRL